MNVLNHQAAVIPTAKLTGYLLSETHPDGKDRAAFFKGFGFTLDGWHELEQALGQHAANHQVTKIEPSPFGMRYVVEGIMPSPDGRSPFVRTVWFIEDGETVPRFVSAYPLRRPDDD